jgi:predicted nuclease of predicted toxin-antitoxin system
MRLLFDEQLSNRLPLLLVDCYPDSLHIESLNLGGAPDIILWQPAEGRVDTPRQLHHSGHRRSPPQTS